MTDENDEFMAYLEMGKHFCIAVKNLINDEDYINATFQLGQLHSALDFKLEELKGGNNGCENQENSENKC